MSMDVPAYSKPLIVTDAAVNIAPSLDQKRDICQNAIDLLHLLGIEEPRVAVLAAVETVNPKMPTTLDAAALTVMAARGQIRGARVDGPLAFDNAISFAAAKTKDIDSAVAGQADILLVPDLEAGNMLAKQLIYFAGADAAGLVLGARLPIIMTSRADSLRVTARLGRTRETGCGARSRGRGATMSAPLLLTFNPGSSSVKIGLSRSRKTTPTRIGLGTIDFRQQPLLLHVNTGGKITVTPLKVGRHRRLCTKCWTKR